MKNSIRRSALSSCLVAFLLLSPTLVDGFLATLTTISTSRPAKYRTQPPQWLSPQAVTNKETTTEPLQLESLRALDSCTTATSARRVLVEQKTSTACSLFASIAIPPGASDRGISDGDLAIQTKIRNKKYGIFDLIDLNGDRDADRASAGVLGIFLAATLSALAAQESLPGPEIVRFVVVWILSFTPLAVVGYGIATPQALQALLVRLQRDIFPTYRQRMIQHEAGHFLMAHLLGFPIQGYSTNAVKNAVEFYPLSDPDIGKERAQQLGFDNSRQDPPKWTAVDNNEGESVPFFSKEGRGGEAMEAQSVFRKSKNYTDNEFLKLSSINEPRGSWPFRGFSHAQVDQLAAISMGGVCAEILALGNAEGGVADFSQLKQIMASAEPELTERDMENRIRFSLGFTMSQLRLHLGALDALANVMERGGSVAECVYAIETCSNVSGNDGIFGDFDLRRRQRFKAMGVGALERILLNEKNADTEENRLVEGKGGGYRQDGRLINISGDDPLYIALGIALVFLVWASEGGLSLH